MDYAEVTRFKIAMLQELYELMGQECFESEDYKEFYEGNKHWLEPYAAFCFFRDKYGTSHFEKWKTNGEYRKEEIDRLFTAKSTSQKSILFYCFVQFHLHLQL